MSKIYPYAGFWKRFGAFVIDSIILSIPSMIISGILFFISLRPLLNMSKETAPSSDVIFSSVMQLYGSMFALQILSIVLFWLYYSWMESGPRQATFGKMVFGIKVVSANGQRLTFWHATGRTLGKFISGMTLYIGFLIAGANKHKQALHDIMASAYVVDKNYQPGEPLPEVEPHYVVLGVTIAGMLLAFLLPFFLIFALAFSQALEDANREPNTPDDVSAAAVSSVDTASVQRRVEDSVAQSKLYVLKGTPKEHQKPITEKGFAFSFLDDGTVRAQREGEPASYAFVMKPNENWPCCEPLVPNGCKEVENVDICQDK